ncbi:MAG: acyl-CoA dehydrogenase family protein, partial [Kiloniellales bacterium]|nr:acyl-CoA dehydrogenase family protein [Kiloniellales bacterium]
MALDPETLTVLLDTIRRFVRERLVPLEAQVADEDRVPDDILAEMRELGLFGMTIPQAYGGLGLSMEEEVLATFELGWTSPAFRSAIGTNNGIGSLGLIADGTEAQKDAYLPRLASGDLIASFALTEPDAGSDPSGMRSTAVRDGADYVLNGTKRYITNAPRAGLFTVFARTDPDAPGTQGISAFLVEADTPGLDIGAPERKMGQQGAPVADVILKDCRVRADALLGGVEGAGFKTAMKTLDRGRLHVAALCTGIAERLIHESVTFACERRQFGERIADFQLIQAMLADSRTEAYAARSMVLDAARRRDAGERITTEAACCKLFCSETVGRVADRA